MKRIRLNPMTARTLNAVTKADGTPDQFRRMLKIRPKIVPFIRDTQPLLDEAFTGEMKDEDLEAAVHKVMGAKTLEVDLEDQDFDLLRRLFTGMTWKGVSQIQVVALDDAFEGAVDPSEPIAEE